MLIATPEYNYSVSGVLKNAIDWVSRTGPSAIRSASRWPSWVPAPVLIGTARAQYDLRRMFVYLDAHVLNKPEVMITAANTRFDAHGNLTDDKATRQIPREPPGRAAGLDASPAEEAPDGPTHPR